jgi:hypothetical protein
MILQSSTITALFFISALAVLYPFYDTSVTILLLRPCYYNAAIKTKLLIFTNNMNRKKKLNQEFQKKKKIANQKGNAKTKAPYVSKADRAKGAENDTALS